MAKRRKKKKSRHILTYMVLLIGVGIASYIVYQERVNVMKSAKEFIEGWLEAEQRRNEARFASWRD